MRTTMNGTETKTMGTVGMLGLQKAPRRWMWTALMVISLGIISSGCRSMTGQSRSPLAELEMCSAVRMSPEMRTLATKIAKAKDDHEAAGLARDALSTLAREMPDADCEAASVSETAWKKRLNAIIVKDECESIASSVRCHVDGTEADEAAVEDAEKASKKLAELVNAGVLEKSDECAYRAASWQLMRFAQETHLRLGLAEASEQFESAGSPDDAIAACELGKKIIEDALAIDMWSLPEKKSLRERTTVLGRKAKELAAESDDIARVIDTEIRRIQSGAVASNAVADLKEANEAYEHERSKHLNWRIFCYFRDNPSAINHVVMLSDRVRIDDRTPFVLRERATNLRCSAYDRLSRKQKTHLNMMPSMDPYDSSPGFPRVSAAEREQLIASMWRQRKENYDPEIGSRDGSSNTLTIRVAQGQ